MKYNITSSTLISRLYYAYLYLFILSLLSGCSAQHFLHTNIKPQINVVKRTDYSLSIILDPNLVNAKVMATNITLTEGPDVYAGHSPATTWNIGRPLRRMLVNCSRAVCDDVHIYDTMPGPGTSDLVIRFSMQSSELLITDRQTGMKRYREGKYTITINFELYDGHDNTFLTNHILSDNGYSFYYINTEVDPSDLMAFCDAINKAHHKMANQLAIIMDNISDIR